MPDDSVWALREEASRLHGLGPVSHFCRNASFRLIRDLAAANGNAATVVE